LRWANLGVRGKENLKTVVKLEAVNHISADATAHFRSCLKETD
jgi:hypothetical protein